MYVWSLSTDALKGVKTDGVKGVYAPEEALDRLLSNTELRSNFTGKRTVTILESVVAGRERPGSSADHRCDGIRQQAGRRQYVRPHQQPRRQQDQHAADRDSADDQRHHGQADQRSGAQSVGQALRYTPGVLAESYGGASQFDAFTQVRGFTADFYLDGQRLPNGLTSTSWASSVIEPPAR